MNPRPPGERDTPERDARESLIGIDQAQLDTRQDLSIKRLERRVAWFMWVSSCAVGLAFSAVVAVVAHEHATGTPPAPPSRPPVAARPACNCPDLSCPGPVCPTPVCPVPICSQCPSRHRR